MDLWVYIGYILDQFTGASPSTLLIHEIPLIPDSSHWFQSIGIFLLVFLNITIDWLFINHSMNHIFKKYTEVHDGRLLFYEHQFEKKTEKPTDQRKTSDD